MKIKFLVIEGNIGAGKTTLATKISEDYNAKLIAEQFEDNPFLPKFYADADRYSFPLELSFLADRYNQFKKEVMQPDLFKHMVVSDYYFTKSAIFAGITLQKDEFRLFKRLFDIAFESLPKPDLYVYLHLDIGKLMRNIRKRGRVYEQNINPYYLETIQKGYFETLKQITQFPVVIIDINGTDFVEKKSDYELLKDIIFNKEFEFGINRIIP